jgi:hypothetical protein
MREDEDSKERSSPKKEGKKRIKEAGKEEEKRGMGRRRQFLCVFDSFVFEKATCFDIDLYPYFDSSTL